MSGRVSWIVSGVIHAMALWAIAAADWAWLRPDFAVRAGLAAQSVSQAARPRVLEARIDTRVEPAETPQLEVEPPAFPDESLLSNRPSEPLVEGERYIARPPIDALHRRRTERAAVAVNTPNGPPMPRDRRETVPESDGRRLDPLWTAVPEAESPDRREVIPRPTPMQRVPAMTVAVVDPGMADQAAVGSNRPQGAMVDRLPTPLPANPEPIYPEELRRRRIGGRVILAVTIAEDGRVSSVEVAITSGQTLLDQSAVATVRQWRFQPARRNGVAVPFSVRLPINFTIRG